ncbi:MAG: 50S ribosomal protein L10 [Cyanobacteria bacterium]|nr:50S ribosomal protein L10 [Cyanobacteriota bacterium]MDW8200229.1 50S ribosomal protein L10 [Cyanobacteriota bacterium SKYGB_h_bin112]
MGKTLEAKREIVEELKQDLSESQLTLIIDYKGLTVAEITDLRRKLRPAGAKCTVAKNTLMRVAVDGDTTWQPITNFLANSSAFIFIKDDIAAAIKAYQDFQKASKKTELRGGVMEGIALNEQDLKTILDLPPKEVLIARIAGAIKAMPTRLAVAVNAVPTKLAVGIKEVPNKLVRAIKAVSEKDSTSNAA